ncbi:MAG: hypothetical protein CFE21_09095 [Bacteroidetes bacterium B1(2017)]|nr:MAG: hypothetical protein CFE21_09095 [Bacteroidetes bacterium B1(2017)]
MKFKKLQSTFFLVLLAFTSLAQEVKLPLYGNPVLQALQPAASKPTLFKQGTNFPFQDFFETNGKTNGLYWKNNSCDIATNKVIFNALDSNNLVYVNAPMCDELISNSMDLSATTQTAFASFTISTGTTYTAGDSLILFGRDIFGQWQEIWNSNAYPVGTHEVLINLAKETFVSNQFALRFLSYSSNLLSSNTNIYTLSKVIVAQKWPLGFYDQMRLPHALDSVPSWEYFAAPNVKIVDGFLNSYPWGNCAKLDVRNIKGVVYDNASNQYGGADTLYTYPFDVLSQDVGDSIYYSFALSPNFQNSASDSLLVEFKNNLGVWVKVLALSGTSINNLTTYTFPINTGRFRFANFQSRFVFKSTYSNSNKAHWLVSAFKVIKKVPLPFFDDFSNSRVQVSSERWLDKNVFVNNDFPVNQPSLNVATFDGLDANGNAYSKFNIKSTCDILTSRSINLKGLTPADSVIFSCYFQYEPQDLTNQVYPSDSLVIEFRNSAMDKDSFGIVMMICAKDTFLNRFTYFEYVLTNPKFFHDDFQIRIRNRGSLTGNLNQWHVDYIRFNKGRKRRDAIKDLALSNTPPVLLGMYTSMPWNQYEANKGKYGNLSDKLRLVNHDNQPYAVDYFRSVLKSTGDTLDKFNNILPSIAALSDSSVNINKPVVFTGTNTSDSIVFETRYRVKISGNQNDNVTGNDTFSVPTIFSNYFAYDDGTAEGGYGIKNKVNVGACLKYTLEKPDSIVGVYVFFNQSETDVSTQRFNLKVWKSISPLFEQATSDVVLYSQEVLKPIYTNKINGFTAFKFSQSIAVSDSFLIGWDQTSAYVLNVGLDKNFRFNQNPNMFYKSDGRWYPTEIPGALMIRPIMGKFLGVPTGISEPTTLVRTDFSIYPNPAAHELTVGLEDLETYKISLVDIAGQEIATLHATGNKIDLPTVAEGFYVLVFENPKTEQKFAKKLIIRQ